MSRSLLETFLGGLVLLLAIGFIGYAYNTSSAGDPGGYELFAQFDRIDGLDPGSDVRVSGIKVGVVLGQELDPTTYRANVRFSVQNGLELPIDSSVAIASVSLLGGKFLSLRPGAEEDMLAPGEEMQFTQSSINLEDLVSQYIFSGTAE